MTDQRVAGLRRGDRGDFAQGALVVLAVARGGVDVQAATAQQAVDDAIALFSGEDNSRAREIWLVDPAPVVIEKLKDARRRGLKVYHGQLATDSNNVECFFCTDSFEVENDHIYFNALECSF